MSTKSNKSSDEENDAGFGSEIQSNGNAAAKCLVRRGSEASSDISTITVSSSDSGHGSREEAKINFQLRSYVTEKRKQKLWDIEFNNFLKPGQPKVFAVVGGSQFSIYECMPSGPIKLQMCFEAPDVNDKKEDFYSCCWSVNSLTKRSVLVVAGELGIIRIMQPEIGASDAQALIGHGKEVNQLKISPRMPFLLASASSDTSIRLWNIETLACIATFHGEMAHRADVITIDFNRDCTKLVSGGIDHLLAIWDLSVPEIKENIEKSRHYDPSKSRSAIKTVLQCFPIFRTRQIHSNYIDCVQWFNEFILSKSNNNDFHCWAPTEVPNNSSKVSDGFTKLATLDIQQCTYYWERFALNIDQSLVALGNDKGVVYIYDLTTDDPADIPFVTLTHPKCTQIIRQFSFSRCGRELVFCCEDGTIWHYQRQNDKNWSLNQRRH